MPISEAQLETWSKQGPTGQFTSTYATLREVLNSQSSPYYGKNFEIFLQGSYKNDTNVYGDSDVDIVIRLDEIFYSDTHFLNEEEKARYNSSRSPASYTLADFKASVVQWLTRNYGTSIDVRKKAIFIKGNGSRRDADVLVCAKLRRYLTYPASGSPSYVDGICFFLPDGTRIENFPEKHSENCTTKHQDTKQWFKHTVRIFKNFCNKLVTDGALKDGIAPSYFIEGLIYNVPVVQFGGSEQRNFSDVFDWIVQADHTSLVCANEQFYLLRVSDVTWLPENCTTFMAAIRKGWEAG